ncbi:MAG: uracil-DNA glycosylase, partial [Lachnospiraceae bacterium]|nr:uracil-DNA glycosylase [Lachnospiraceae bacterium]
MGMLKGGWELALRNEFKQEYYRELYQKVLQEYQTKTVYPPSQELFRAFELTPLEKVKAVILGQDPYHEPGQAEGLCFSVKPGVDIPPSLQNIFQELESDVHCQRPNHGSLIHWASQGVFLLNTILTVRAHQAASHRGLGWEQFTDAAIRVLNSQDRPMVFMLWGRPAGEKQALLDNPKHLVLTAPHPSPLSAY